MLNRRFGTALAVSLVFVCPTIIGLTEDTELNTGVIRIFILLFSFFIVLAILYIYDHQKMMKESEIITQSEVSMNFYYFIALSHESDDDTFYITVDEKVYIEELIQNFISRLQKKITKGEPFLNNLSKHYRKAMRKLSREECAFLYFHCYLEEIRVFYDSIAGERLAKYKERKEKYTEIYSLTPSGYAYYKLLRVVKMYCKEHTSIKNVGIYGTDVDYIESHLRSGIVEGSCF